MKQFKDFPNTVQEKDIYYNFLKQCWSKQKYQNYHWAPRCCSRFCIVICISGWKNSEFKSSFWNMRNLEITDVGIIHFTSLIIVVDKVAFVMIEVWSVSHISTVFKCAHKVTIWTMLLGFGNVDIFSYVIWQFIWTSALSIQIPTFTSPN